MVPGLDLMPEVVVPSRQHVFFEKIDEIARASLVPLFLSVLEGSGLTTEFSLYPPVEPSPGRSATPFMVAVRTSDEYPLPLLTRRVAAWDSFEGYATSHPGKPAPSEFGLPGYVTGSSEAR